MQDILDVVVVALAERDIADMPNVVSGVVSRPRSRVYRVCASHCSTILTETSCDLRRLNRRTILPLV